MTSVLFTADGLVGLLFLLMIAITISGALIAVCSSILIRSVTGLALCFLGVAGIYYYLGSPFVALMQILIYVGAVCVVIIFAIMLAEPDEQKRTQPRTTLISLTALASCTIVVGAIIVMILSTCWRSAPRIASGSVEQVGRSLLTTYSMSFELVSVVLLVAIIGSLVLARAGRDKS